MLGPGPIRDGRLSPYHLEETRVMRAPALLGNVDHRPSENAHQRVDVVAAALGFVVGQQPQADGLQCPHTAFDNSLDETGAGAEIVMHGGVVALAGLGGDVTQRHPRDHAAR